MRRNELIAQFIFIFGIALFAVIAGFFAQFLVNAPLAFLVITCLFLCVGFFMFLKAKLSTIKKGKLISFGIKDMSPTNRICYILGYIFMIISFSMAICIICFSR